MKAKALGKYSRHRGEAALLVFVDVQIGPVNGGAEENGVCIPLDPDLILAARIDQPSLFLRANFFQQRSDIDAGTDELKVLHEAFPSLPSPVTIALYSVQGRWNCGGRAREPRLLSGRACAPARLHGCGGWQLRSTRRVRHAVPQWSASARCRERFPRAGSGACPDRRRPSR